MCRALYTPRKARFSRGSVSGKPSISFATTRQVQKLSARKTRPNRLASVIAAVSDMSGVSCVGTGVVMKIAPPAPPDHGGAHRFHAKRAVYPLQR